MRVQLESHSCCETCKCGESTSLLLAVCTQVHLSPKATTYLSSSCTAVGLPRRLDCSLSLLQSLRLVECSRLAPHTSRHRQDSEGHRRMERGSVMRPQLTARRPRRAATAAVNIKQTSDSDCSCIQRANTVVNLRRTFWRDLCSPPSQQCT